MVYKNLLTRLCISIFIFFIYLISLYNLIYLFLIGIIIYLVIIFEVFKYFKYFFFPIYIYIVFSLLNFILYFSIFFELLIFNILVLVIICFDTFSYLTGIFLGKNFVLKKISPKKTIEGYIGGIFFTNLICLIFFKIYQFNISIFYYLLLVNLIIFSSFMGDFIQSYFKRKNKLKDSSNFLPGHGGFFDRFDSFLSSIMIITLFSYFNL